MFTKLEYNLCNRNIELEQLEILILIYFIYFSNNLNNILSTDKII